MPSLVPTLALSSALLSAAATILVRQGLRGSDPYTTFWINCMVGVAGMWLAVLATGAFAMFETTLALLTKREFGLDERGNGWVFAWIGFCLVLAQGMLVRRLMPRLGEVRLAQIGTLLLGGGFLLLTQAHALGALYAVVPVIVVGFAFLTPSLSSLVSRRTSPETQGEILGVHQSGLALARILGPLAGNVLQGRGLDLPYQVGAGALLVAFLLALGLGSLPRAGAGGAGGPEADLT